MKMDEIPRRVHFVGVGGVGMSGLAQHLYRLGYDVSGSDRCFSERTNALKKLGITVEVGHNVRNIGDAQLVVRTSAVGLNNEEIVAATEKGVPVVLREELLGAIFNDFETRIAVCGTHGKTTVTAMLHQILCSANIDHAAFIGGVYHGENYFAGENVVVAEACEFNRSFYNLRPTICICLNAEHDHPDCYKDVEDVRHAFAHFFQNVERGGKVVLPSELKGLSHRNRVLFDKANKATNVVLENGFARFECVTCGGESFEVQLNVPGEHNVNNALAAVAAAQLLDVPNEKIAEGLKSFDGVDRRWTELYKAGPGKVVLDYAHHPTEIACSVATAKSITHGRVFCVFQPHTYSRTKAFWRQFAECFAEADSVAYLPIYSAREKPISGVNSYLLSQDASKMGVNACFLPDFLTARKWIYGNVGQNDLLLILGAGDVCQLADML